MTKVDGFAPMPHVTPAFVYGTEDRAERTQWLRAENARLRSALREEAEWLKEKRFFDRAKRVAPQEVAWGQSPKAY